ncbi:hypothetical protein SK128_027575 [Halocaridina rubra]|uniref:Uncharacterized protein n=1 Tax=Halocaridina rubra TaxID=373956 RepID=A0AAN8XAH7_HALRR
MEEVHKIVVPREYKTFKSLSLFYQWLSTEEKKYSVRYIRDTTRIEKEDMKLIQLVCHRFHTAKMDQTKGKKEGESTGEDESPNKIKRRWFVRIQRSSNCHARIHLKVQYNPSTEDYDGETQMVYYPQHTHDDDDHPQEHMTRVMERHSRGKYRNGNRKVLKQGVVDKKKGIKDDLDGLLLSGEGVDQDGQNVISGSLKLEEGSTLSMDQYMKDFCQTQLKGDDGSHIVVSMASTVSASGKGRSGQGAASTVLMDSNMGDTTSLFVNNSSNSDGTAMLVESGEPGTYVVEESAVMDVSEGDQSQKDEGTEEYVLPADESEWTKLFEVLRLRLMTQDLNEEEKAEGDNLLSYENVISYLPLSEQVTIFQQLCLLTNTAIETAD